MSELIRELCGYGARPSDLVDVMSEHGARALPYLDLARAPAGGGRPPVVFEVQSQPQAYVFDGREPYSPHQLSLWVRRVSFRGDAAWVGVLRPGRLDVYRASLDGAQSPAQIDPLPPRELLLPSLVHRPRGTEGGGIRLALLGLLRGSVARAKELGASSGDALALVGRALFWRFLIDRGLLDGLDPARISPNATSLESCLDRKTRAIATFEWLDETFNGGLLPLERSATVLRAELFQEVVGNIAHAATLDGQLPLALPRQWREVNFAHVPVGLLSEVYEAHAHAENATKATAESIFYTPRHIAELVIRQALEAVVNVDEPKVLDPAAGAGVFLVAAFRALVAREWQRSGAPPTRRVVRRILERQLVGLDINQPALRLAQLALYLTAIEVDPEPKPRPLALLRFADIWGTTLRPQDGGLEQGSLGPVTSELRGRFDLVVGNPPWTAARSSRARTRWEEDTRILATNRLGPVRGRGFRYPGTYPDLPFAYRAAEWARPQGIIALITHARWLFGQSSSLRQARADLLDTLHVTGVLNGAALRDTQVWPNVRHPFAVLFARNEAPPPGAAFRFVSPDLDAFPDSVQERLRVDWLDAQPIAIADLARRPWALKARFRGTVFDESVIEHALQRGTPLRSYLEGLQPPVRLRNGYQVQSGTKSAVHLLELPDLRNGDLTFLINHEALPPFTRPMVHRPRARAIYRAPLLVIDESIRVDQEAPRSGLALSDIVFDERFSGASFVGVENGEEIARYLQVFLQSNVVKHALLMLDGQFGIEREVVHLATIQSLPVIPWHHLDRGARARVQACSKALHSGASPRVLADIDELVGDLLSLSDVQRAAIADTLATMLPTAAEKERALAPTTPLERSHFARVCETELGEVLESSEQRVRVRTRDDLAGGSWRFVQIDIGSATAPRNAPRVSLDPAAFLEAADEGAASAAHVHVSAQIRLVGLLDRYRYWTETRARLLASDVTWGVD